MKKLFSMVLAALLLLSLLIPAAAGGPDIDRGPLNNGGKLLNAPSAAAALRGESEVPLILVSGDGRSLYDADGNEIYTFPNVAEAFANGDEEKLPDGFDLKKTITVLLKSYVKSILTFQEQKFYDKLESEIRSLSEPILMDENGNPRNGTGIGAKALGENAARMTTPNQDTTYAYQDYVFCYDWRCSPMEVADALDAYIEAVCEMTGKPQVALVGRCLGTNIVMAYLTKYGAKNRIRGLGLDVGMMNGQDPLSESISGKFSSDGDAILRFMADTGVTPSDWLHDLLVFMQRAGIFDNVNASVKARIYSHVAKGVTSALAMSTLFTMPSFWSCVSTRDYNDAMLYVFGKEGSAKRKQYAGLIEKVQAYHDLVQLPMEDTLKSFIANGGKIAVICKYGYQLMPMCDSRNLAADTFVSVRNASFGATTSLNYNTLSKKYLKSRETLGFGKYISPDKKIDASTCLFRDTTWFIKNMVHAEFGALENAILLTVTTAEEQYTVDDFGFSQFLVCTDETTKEVSPMTAENCNTEHWEYTDPAALSFGKRMLHMFDALRALFGDNLLFLGARLRGE